MNSVTTIPLKRIIDDLESGGRPKGGIVEGKGEVFSIGGEHLNDYGGFDFANERRVPIDFFREMKRGKVKPKDVLIVKDGATTGKVSYVPDDFPELPCSINEHVFRLSINPDLADAKYIFYYLYGARGNREIMRDFRGATIGGISQDFVKYVHVPLPSLPEQYRIADILDKADRLRRLRRYALELSDSYLRSVFLETNDGRRQV
jgi:type I restriction enzyme S subunit